MFKRVSLIFCILSSIVAALAVTVCFACLAKTKIKFKKDYYFVYYRVSENDLAVSSMSGAFASFGGAGYILEYKKNYYVTLSCYFNTDDAKKVCDNLKKDINCSVLSVNLKYLEIKNKDKKNSLLYIGNLNTLNSLSDIAYACANQLDRGELSQEKARKILANIKSSIFELLKSNENNSFTKKIKYLIATCNAMPQTLLSGNLRYLQIAIIDCILNFNQ